jgi:hypothetical protein
VKVSKFSKLGKIKKGLVGLAVLGGLLAILPASAQAGGVDFSISAPKTALQHNQDVGYPDLRMKAGDSVTVSININNTSEQEASFDIMLHSAGTNQNGVIDYTGKSAPDSSAPYTYEKIAKLSAEKATVPAKSQGTITVEVALPAEANFKGQLLGGVTITRALREDEKVKNGFSSQFAYVEPIVITMGDDKPAPEVVAGEVSVNDQKYATSILMPLSNPTENKIGNGIVHATVTSVTGETVFDQTYNNREWAPNSSYNLTLPLELKQNLIGGDYKLSVDITDDKNHNWNFNKNFQLTAKDAEAANAHNKDFGRVTAPAKKKAGLDPWAIAVFGIIILFLVTAIIVFGRKLYVINSHNFS